MDELQISGRRFISSRRIAKDNGYHTDYIGQLIRGGKIKGQKVGRTWYVDAESFDVYLGGEAASAKLPAEKVLGSASPQPDHFPQEVLPVPAPAPVVAEKIIEEKKIEIKKVAQPAVVSARYVPVASGGLRYVPDTEPLLPEISSVSVESRTVVTTSALPTEEKFLPHVEMTATRRPSAARMIGGLAVAGVVIFIFSAVVSSTVFEKINIEAGNPASVRYGIEW